LKHLRIALTIYLIWLSPITGYTSYPDSSAKARMELLFNLPKEVMESSGLIYFQNKFWTFNDSGGDPVLFAINPNSGKISKKITVSNASNVDWEEITQDKLYLYIGDFGNNFGIRKDLKIYRILKSKISTETNDQSVKADIIEFNYADQKNFDKQLYHTSFDCEAMIIWGDSIVVFTKNWKDETSSIYCIPKFPGKYTVAPSFVFQSHGLVTGAALSENNKELAIVGYEEFIPFTWFIKIDNSLDFRKNRKTRKSYLLMSGVQTEGICFGPSGYLFISCENSMRPQSLFRLNPEHFRK